MRRIIMLLTAAAMMAVLMVASAAPAMADHWFLYEDSEGECGWNVSLVYPFWEYDCHEPPPPPDIPPCTFPDGTPAPINYCA